MPYFIKCINEHNKIIPYTHTSHRCIYVYIKVQKFCKLNKKKYNLLYISIIAHTLILYIIFMWCIFI